MRDAAGRGNRTLTLLMHKEKLVSLYVKSQKHEGWILVEKEYSDGGISGGNIRSFSLKRIIARYQRRIGGDI